MNSITASWLPSRSRYPVPFDGAGSSPVGAPRSTDSGTRRDPGSGPQRHPDRFLAPEEAYAEMTGQPPMESGLLEISGSAPASEGPGPVRVGPARYASARDGAHRTRPIRRGRTGRCSGRGRRTWRCRGPGAGAPRGVALDAAGGAEHAVPFPRAPRRSAGRRLGPARRPGPRTRVRGPGAPPRPFRDPGAPKSCRGPSRRRPCAGPYGRPPTGSGSPKARSRPEARTTRPPGVPAAQARRARPSRGRAPTGSTAPRPLPCRGRRATSLRGGGAGRPDAASRSASRRRRTTGTVPSARPAPRGRAPKASSGADVNPAAGNDRSDAGPPSPPATRKGPHDRSRAGPLRCSQKSYQVRSEAAGAYLLILVTWPAPTVRPPSRMANFRPSSMAMGWMSSTFISVLSPGMTISVPSGRVTTPVTSVVRK